jgi:hypothetical protein
LRARPIVDKEPEVTSFVKDLVQKLAEGSSDQNAFTTELRSEIFPARAERVARLLKSLGTLNNLELVERGEKGDFRVYGYQLTFQNGSRFLKMSLTKESKIAEIAFIDDF